MSHYNGCGCGGHMHNSCNSCTSHNEIQQAVNDALAFEKENLEQYETNAAQSATDAAKEAADAATSASAAAQSQANAETAAGTATQAAASVTNTAVVLEETAERIEHAQDLLEEQISALQTKPVYFEISTPTNKLVLPESETVFNVRSIYVASARQDVGYGFTFDKTTRTITLAEEITADQIAKTAEGFILATAICDVYSSDDPTSFPIVLASNAGANNVGTSTGATVEARLTTLDSAVDPTLRSDLASPVVGLGANLVALEQKGTVQDALHKVINVEAFKSYNISDDDWGPAFRAALAYAKDNSIPIVEFQGFYNITSYDTDGWVAPFDDGSVSPSRISSGTDSAIAPEETTEFPVYLNMPFGVSLRSTDRRSNGLIFGWDSSKGAIDETVAIAIVCRVNGWDGTYLPTATAVNRYSAMTRSNFSGFTIGNAFVGIISDGVMQYAHWDGELGFANVGIPIMMHGYDLCDFGRLYAVSCYAAFTFGGWWMQRNASNAYANIPPYTGTVDIRPIGWFDAGTFGYISWAGRSTWDDRHTQIDAWFDKYIYKTANQLKANKTSPSGIVGTGRLSSTLDNLTTDAYASYQAYPFRGIASRGIAFINRYQNSMAGNIIYGMKTLNTRRVPLLSPYNLVSQNLNNVVQNYYCELVGYYSSARTAFWYEGLYDVWNTDQTVMPAIMSEGIFQVQSYAAPNVARTAPTFKGTQNTRLLPQIGSYNYSYTISAENVAATLDKIQGWNGTKLSVWYHQHTKYMYSQPISFVSADYSPSTTEIYFRSKAYKTSKFNTPVIYSGTDPLGTNSSWFKSYSQDRYTVSAYMWMYLPSGIASNTGIFRIALNDLPVKGGAGFGISSYPLVSIGQASCSSTILTADIVTVDGVQYIQFYSDQSRTTAVTCDKFVGSTHFAFKIEYIAESSSAW